MDPRNRSRRKQQRRMGRRGPRAEVRHRRATHHQPDVFRRRRRARDGGELRSGRPSPATGSSSSSGQTAHVVQQIRVGGQTESGAAQVNGVTGITSCRGSLWLAEPGGSRVWQIDPVSVRIINSTAVPGNPTFVACSAGGLWVASVTNGTITEIDTNTARVERSVHIGGTPAGIAANERSVWVSVDERGGAVP